MEVPEKLGDQEVTIVCLPCERDGLKEPVFGFCEDCQEHLCETCYKHHRRARPSRKHVLLDIDSMPKIQCKTSATADDTTDSCSKHTDKALEFYCNNHKSVVCYVCVTMDHKHCKVDYIPDVSGDMSAEMNDIFQQMASLTRKCKSNLVNADMAVHNLERTYMKVVENIKLFRKEINECLDQMEAKIIREADGCVEDSKHKQDKLKAACEEISEELDRSQSFLNVMSEENKLNSLFIELKNAEKRLQILNNKEKEVSEANDINDFIDYSRNTSLIDSLKTDYAFGQLTFTSMDRVIDMQYSDSIEMKSPSDTKECNITGLVIIASSKIIAADTNNKSIKLFDVDKHSLVTEIKMSSQPADVSLLPENKVAVTLRDEKCIQIISYTETDLSLCNRVSVGESCNGVACCKDKFVVSCFAMRRINILSLSGEAINVLDLPTILNGPLRVVISNDEKFIYISDTDLKQKNKVLKIDWEGNVKYIFEDPDYTLPYSIQELEDESLLICYSGSHTVIRLSSRFEKLEIVGLGIENLFNPKALTYRDRDHKLYVSCSSKKRNSKVGNDVVRAFNVKWRISNLKGLCHD